MNASDSVPSREQQSYWSELVQLKADACYVRDYRNELGRVITVVATIRAVTSSGSIAAWAIWKQYAYSWAFLIAASQMLDALRNVFPFYKRREALSRWSRTLDKLFVVAQRDWDEIAGGRLTDVEIRRALDRLRSKKQITEAKYIPNGLTRKQNIFDRAQKEAGHFFNSRYGLISE